MHAILLALLSFAGTFVTWFFKEAMMKFLIFTSVFLLVSFFVPYIVKLLIPFIGLGDLAHGISEAFSNSGVCFVLNFFRIEYGLKLLISALASRFLIRRIPFIG
jgi:hypothetical protein